MPLQATSGAASYDAFGGGVPVVPAYIEEVFQTWLYTGTGSAQTITNGIDLSTKGGLLWLKARNDTRNNWLYDTTRSIANGLRSDSIAAATSTPDALTAFNSNGFSIGTSGNINTSGNTLVSWTFRKAPKFFDVVTWTHTGTNGRVINHSLGSTPGMIIVKNITDGGSWPVWHRSAGTGQSGLYLQKTDAFSATSEITSVNSTSFTLSNSGDCNGETGSTGIAYLFAHNAGGFGLTGTDNVISCGLTTANGSGDFSVNLGYEPQWVLMKSTGSGIWSIVDNMRGATASSGYTSSQRLQPQSSAAEDTLNGGYGIGINATGFTGNLATFSNDFIYIAIRRGPMKVPTSGTSVFKAITRTGTGAAVTVSGAGFAPDLVATACRDFNGFGYYDKLRGALKALRPSQTSAEATYTTTLTGFTNDGYTAGSNSDGFGEINGNTDIYINHLFKRAPSFFDEVCYTGNGGINNVQNHSLADSIGMLIIKQRDSTGNWSVFVKESGGNYSYWNSSGTGTGQGLNGAGAATGTNYSGYNSYLTNTTFNAAQIDGSNNINANGGTFVAYLFATCAGVSKIGNYTGNGTTQTIDCGFTGGARFVLIKRTDSTGSWYVWDVARGISSGNDPYLLLNSTAAEVTNTDYIDAYSAGFEISSTAPAEINASGGSFIFLAIS